MIMSEGSKPYCYRAVKGDGVMSTPVGELFRQASELAEQARATLAGLLHELRRMEEEFAPVIADGLETQ